MVTPEAQQLDYEYQLTDRILGDGKIFSSMGYFDSQEPPWLKRPRKWYDFDKNNVQTIPATGLDAVIVSFDTPVGHDGVIEGFSIQYQSSDRTLGDLIYRIFIEDRPVKNYEAILTDLGTVQIPRETRIRIYSGTTVQIRVSHVNNDALTDKNLIGTLKGYTYSRSEV